MRLGVPENRLGSIESEGLAALPAIDRACWDAFLVTDPPPDAADIALGGVFAGIGWDEAEHNLVAKRSARWLSGGRVASVFLRVKPTSTHDIYAIAHHVPSLDTAHALQLTVCGHRLETRCSLSEDGTAILTAEVPAAIVKAHDGRLWLKPGFADPRGPLSATPVTFSKVEIEPIGARERLARRIDREISSMRSRRQSVGAVTASLTAHIKSRGTTIGRSISQVKPYFDVVISDPIGSIPRIRRRIARFTRIRGQ